MLQLVSEMLLLMVFNFLILFIILRPSFLLMVCGATP